MAQNIRIMEILREAKKLAQEYRALTGKPLGITGEVAEYEAARILGLELTLVRQAGYDALEKRNGSTHRLQIKGRCLPPNCKPRQRLSSIDLTKDWDAVLMVLLDQNFDAVEIHEAQRAAVITALSPVRKLEMNAVHLPSVSSEQLGSYTGGALAKQDRSNDSSRKK